MLKGAAQVLKRAKGILMELPIINLYEGTWGFHVKWTPFLGPEVKLENGRSV